MHAILYRRRNHDRHSPAHDSVWQGSKWHSEGVSEVISYRYRIPHDVHGVVGLRCGVDHYVDRLIDGGKGLATRLRFILLAMLICGPCASLPPCCSLKLRR